MYLPDTCNRCMNYQKIDEFSGYCPYLLTRLEFETNTYKAKIKRMNKDYNTKEYLVDRVKVPFDFCCNKYFNACKYADMRD